MLTASQTQFNNEVTSIFNLETASLKQVAFDYTYWDDFVDNINHPSPAWYDNNITTILKSYHFDFVCVIDTSFKEGMFSLNRSLADLVRKKEISLKNAMDYSLNPTDLKNFLK